MTNFLPALQGGEPTMFGELTDEELETTWEMFMAGWLLIQKIRTTENDDDPRRVGSDLAMLAYELATEQDYRECDREGEPRI